MSYVKCCPAIDVNFLINSGHVFVNQFVTWELEVSHKLQFISTVVGHAKFFIGTKLRLPRYFCFRFVLLQCNCRYPVCLNLFHPKLLSAYKYLCWGNFIKLNGKLSWLFLIKFLETYLGNIAVASL